MRQKFWYLLLAIGLLFLIFVLLNYRTIFQEGNPLPYLSGIIRLHTSGESVVKINTTNEIYLGKAKDSRQAIVDLLSERNFEFDEQLGAGYFFVNQQGERIIATTRHYSRFYQIWKISEPEKIYQVTEIMEISCQSHNDCELPFDYAIQSSCPYEARCLSGKCTIVCPQMTDNWLLIKQAIKNCEVKEIMQTHSLWVSVTLKNGEKIEGYEPEIDDIIHMGVEARELCHDNIILSTE